MSNVVQNSEVPYQLLTALFRSLNHELRTPLSVISNELYVLQAQSQDVEAALRKVREIDSLLGGVQHLLREPTPFQSCTLLDLLSEVSREHDLELVVHGESEWMVDTDLMTRALREFCVIAISMKRVERRVDIQSNGRVVFRSIPPDESRSEKVTSVSQFLSQQGRAWDARIPVIDTVFILHGIILNFEENNTLVLSQVR